MKLPSEIKCGFSGPSREGNCGPTAVATISETPFEFVDTYMRYKNGKKGNWRGASTLHQCLDALRHFGVTFKLASFENLQLSFFIDFLAKPDTTYFLWVPGHFMTLRNGKLFDQGTVNGAIPYTQHRRKNCKIKIAYEIISIGNNEDQDQLLKEF